jgi:hypothetical protein
METVYVLTLVFLISQDRPLEGSFSEAAASIADCQSLKLSLADGKLYRSE